MITEIQIKALKGRNAHLSPARALEGLKLDVTGRKILNTPYTIWQLLKHMNYWQDKWLERLEGKDVPEDQTWKLGWEGGLNAQSQKELDKEVKKLVEGIKKTGELLSSNHDVDIVENEYYKNHHDIVQAMASHLSYHLGELILLRRIFGAWPPPRGGFVW